MENPHEEQQAVLIGRIAANVAQLNETVKRLNEKLQLVNKENEDVAQIAHMWASYSASSEIYLENLKSSNNDKTASTITNKTVVSTTSSDASSR
ncbi:DASH complex subunit Dad4-domain-containing protein [Syncephalastrum racemosum]|uniref:DASH complex subunit DAD4 n=1 Tax=Syncephalastrum racemosum TaxID=13706 RepID=A0A1X2HV21_SYNRA|nr:DASH complex subunit Dad4-domain-containing protein [Syncephalastrum racemosum]